MTGEGGPPPDEGLWDYSEPAGTEARLRGRLGAEADPARRAELLTQVARAEGLQGRFAEGHRTLDEAAALLDGRAGRAGVRCLLERGRLHRSAGQPEPARGLFARAWELGRAGGAEAEAIDAAHMLALVAPPEEALGWGLQALALAERSADPRGRRWVGPLLNNIGWHYHDQGAFAQALAYFQRALAWREGQGQPRETRVARWCVGRALRSLGRTAEALAIQRALLAEATAAGEPDPSIDEEIGELLRASAGRTE